RRDRPAPARRARGPRYARPPHAHRPVPLASGRRVRAPRGRSLPGAPPGAAAVVAVGLRRPPSPPGPGRGGGDHAAVAGGGPAGRLAGRRGAAAPPHKRGLTPNGGRCSFVAARGRRESGTVPASAGTVPTWAGERTGPAVYVAAAGLA